MIQTAKLLAFSVIMFLGTLAAKGQNIISSPKGYTPQIGATVSMLEDLKERVTRSVQGLSTAETDFLMDEDANRIGALIFHLAATEKYYQVYTFENRGFSREERKQWNMPLNLGDRARDEIKGKPISYYLDIWDEVRKETLRLLKTKDDIWFDAMVSGSSMNNHWAWYHVMEHQANHMGQIRMMTKRIK